MLYDDNFVMSLPQENGFEAILKALHVLFRHDEGELSSITPEDIFESRALVLALVELHNLRFPQEVSFPNWRTTTDSETVKNVLTVIQQFCTEQLHSQQSDEKKRDFAILLRAAFSYRLSHADTERIQVLINELRDLISENEKLKEDHRRRLLERLEKLQRELHRRLSSLDRFYGLVGDAGVLLGKFGRDAKPFVDRIREIVEIVWRAQANAEDLPASARPALLTTDKPSDDE